MSSLATYVNSSLAKQSTHQSLVARKQDIVTILQLGNREKECTEVNKSVINMQYQSSKVVKIASCHHIIER